MVGENVPRRLPCYQRSRVILLVAVLTVATYYAVWLGSAAYRRGQPVAIPPHIPQSSVVQPTSPHILPPDAVGIPLKEVEGAWDPPQE